MRSSGEIQIQALAEQYAAFELSLHHHVRADAPDPAALTYTAAPAGLYRRGAVGADGPVARGIRAPWLRRCADLAASQRTGRRRKMFFDGRDTLAVLVASPSDVDDLIPILVAFQIE
ncbi:MAG: hypothetical protein IPP13_14840 [Kouleothrix sp.]|nr:hypothetical protein [Kouleothrix sp.]